MDPERDEEERPPVVSSESTVTPAGETVAFSYTQATADLVLDPDASTYIPLASEDQSRPQDLHLMGNVQFPTLAHYPTLPPRAPWPPPPARRDATVRNPGASLGRNDPCWCGSGKKFKNCHLGKSSR
jgi:hypothetical protein